MKKKIQRRRSVSNFLVKMLLPLMILSIILTNCFAAGAENPVQSQGVDVQSHDLIITLLFDNYSSNKELKTGWGFSCLIQGTQKTILFDIGSSAAVTNMEKLKIDPASIDVLVISHEHSDHTDGISHFMKKNSKVVTFSVPHDSVKICDDVYTTGVMGTNIKENALIIRTAKGLVVITGCAHPGIVEIVQRTKQMFLKDEVYLVMGGFHLFQNDRQTIRRIVSDLQAENVRKVSPSHCTGDPAESLFKEAFGTDFIPGDLGKPIVIEDAFIKPTN